MSDIALAALRSVIWTEPLDYMSCAITTGVGHYQALDAGQDPTRIISVNLAQADAQAAVLPCITGTPVVAPSKFKAAGWSQKDYMDLWISLIEVQIGRIWMQPGWEYSNGAAQEYVAAAALGLGYGSRTGIDARRFQGARHLPIHEAAEELAAALDDLHRRGRGTPLPLAACLLGLLHLHDGLGQRPAVRSAMAESLDGARLQRAVASVERLLHRARAADLSERLMRLLPGMWPEEAGLKLHHGPGGDAHGS